MNKLNLIGMMSMPIVLASCSGQKTTEERPNIVFILADDMGYGDVSAFNENCGLTTKNIDAMAANGVMFTDAHTSSSVSTPTRYGILTGRYNWRSTLKQTVLEGYSRPLISQGRATMASMLKSEGYTTACIGKWHLGWNWGTKEGHEKPGVRDLLPEDVDFTKAITGGPITLGFDYFYGFCGSLDMAPYVYIENDRPTTTDIGHVKKGNHPGFWRAGACASDFDHNDCLPNISRRAVKYIADRKGSDKPFFLYLPLPAPHTPILPTDEFKGKSGLNAYGDFVLMVDDVVGQVRQALKDNGMSENTILVFTTDNGCSPSARITELQEKGQYPNYILRGTKDELFEGGHRIPTVVEWSKAGKGKCSQPICLTDFYATFADIVGHKMSDAEGEDSYNILSLIENPSKDSIVREAIVHHSFLGEFAIRKGDWKLLCSPSSGGWSFPRPGKDDELIATLPKMQLYNLKDDPKEENNVIAEHKDIADELKTLLLKYINDGRSTVGVPQKNDKMDNWTQYDNLLKL